MRQHRSPLGPPTLALSDQCRLAISLSRPLALSHSLSTFFPSPPLSRSCGHAFHAACLEHYFATSRQPGQRPRCPYCRSSVHAPLPVEAPHPTSLPPRLRAVSQTSPEPSLCRRAPSPACRWSLSLRHAAAAGATLTGGGSTTPPPARARCRTRPARVRPRQYRFLDLGDFGRAGMLYLLSSNEDRKTASSAVMWVVEARDAAEGMRPRCGWDAAEMPPRGCGRDAVGMRPRDVVEMWLSLRERLGACAVHHPPQLPLGEARGRGAAGGVAAGQGLRAKRRASPRLQRGTDGEGGGQRRRPTHSSSSGA